MANFEDDITVALIEAVNRVTVIHGGGDGMVIVRTLIDILARMAAPLAIGGEAGREDVLAFLIKGLDLGLAHYEDAYRTGELKPPLKEVIGCGTH